MKVRLFHLVEQGARFMENEVKKKILDTAKELFLKKGYKETKIIDISKAAGISPSTIYLYFKGKKDLFDALKIPEAESYHPQFDSNRSAIMQTALLLFGEKGFDGTSMDMIARELGYSKATLYQYFDNKEDLFAAVMKETPFHFNFVHIKPQIDNTDLKSAIIEIGMNYMSIFDTPERIAFTKSIIRDSNKHPEISAAYHKNGIGYVSQCVADYLTRFKDQLRPDIDLYLAAKTYIGSLFGLVIQYKIVIGVERQYTDKEIVETSAGIFIRGIMK